MDTTQAMPELPTTRPDFEESGTRKAFVDWLDEHRPDVSRSRCVQLGHHAAQLIDQFGADLPQLVVADPEAVAARLDDQNHHRPTGAGAPISHRKRAARALDAWLHDLDPDATRAVMDRQPYGATAHACVSSPAGASEAPESGRTMVDHSIDESIVLAKAPTAYGFFEDCVCSKVALMVDYDGVVPDVRAVGREVVAHHSPGTRRAIAFELAETFDVAVDVPATAKTSLTAVCDELILGVLEKRGVEILDVPLQHR